MVGKEDAILFTQKYEVFCQSVRDGCLGSTAKFWLSYMDHVGLTLKLTQSVKLNDF